MNRYVKNLREYLTESLNQVEWLNYKNDSALNSPNPSEDVLRVAAFVQGVLNVDDASALLFTGADVSIGEDYAYFIDKVIPKSTEEKDKSNHTKVTVILHSVRFIKTEISFLPKQT